VKSWGAPENHKNVMEGKAIDDREIFEQQCIDADYDDDVDYIVDYINERLHWFPAS